MYLINQETANELLFPDRRRREMAKARKALLDPERLNNWQLIEAWAIIGECHKFNREAQLAEEVYLKTLELIRALGDERALGEGYYSIGEAMFFCKDYAKATDYYRQAFEIFKRLGEKDRLAGVLSQMAYAYEKIGQRDEERHCLDAVMLQPAIEPLVKATLLERVALSLGASGEYGEAIRVYEQALSIFESEGFRRDWEKRLSSLAQMYNVIGDAEAAKRTKERL